MRLSDIIKDSGAVILNGTPDTEIRSITSDSRKAAAGSLFIAVKGVDRDGHDYIDAALAAGVHHLGEQGVDGDGVGRGVGCLRTALAHIVGDRA